MTGHETRTTYEREFLLKFKDLPICKVAPKTLDLSLITQGHQGHQSHQQHRDSFGGSSFMPQGMSRNRDRDRVSEWEEGGKEGGVTDMCLRSYCSLLR